MQLPHQGKAAHSWDALGRERDTYAAGVEDDLILHAKNAAQPRTRGFTVTTMPRPGGIEWMTVSRAAPVTQLAGTIPILRSFTLRC